MDYLKVSAVLILTQLMACVTGSSYKINRSFSHRYELKVTPDRVIMECEKNYTDDGQLFYGFFIHILDEEKTVTSIFQTTKMYDDDCFKRVKVLDKAISTSKILYISGVGWLLDARVKNIDLAYDFPKHGKYFSNGRSMSFAYLMNETGFCYDAYNGLDKPCPGEDYPMKPFDASVTKH